MLNNIAFENNHLLLPIVLIGVLLFLVFVWKEWGSKSKNFVINCLVGLVTIISLSLIALQPTILSKSKALEVAFLTDGFRKSSLDSLQKLNKKLKIKNYVKGGNLFNSKEKPTKAYVLGNGIAEYDLWQLKNISSVYISGEPISGITRLKYDSNPNIGESISIRGLYSNPKKGSQLFLVNPSGKSLDSISFSKANSQRFEFSTRLKVAGKFAYSLIEKDSLNTVIKTNPLPLDIEKREVLKMLIISAFPTFEIKYLKNFLAEKKHKVVVRNQLTKGKFKYEFFNTVKERISFSEKVLSSFDLLVIDAKSFLNLGRNQQRVLKSVIENNGLGVFIQPEKSLFVARNSFSNFKFLSNQQNDFAVNSSNQNFDKFKYIFRENASLEPIHKKEKKVYSAYQYLGNGKIATSVAKDTYQKVLSGKLNSYQQFWTDIINSVSKKQLETIDWNNINQFSYKDEPFEFEFQTNKENPEVFFDENQVLLSQDINNSTVWKGKMYPKSIGWYQLKMESDSTNTFSFYVFKDNEYSSLNLFKTKKINKQTFNKASNSSNNVMSKKEVNLFWFYLILLLTLGYLWLEPKL